MRPLRVLQVAASISPSDGGPAVAIVELNRRLRSLGVEGLVMATDAGGAPQGPPFGSSAANQPGEVGVRIYRSHPPRRLKTSLPLAFALKREMPKVDLVHVHGLYLFHTAVTVALARAYRKPIVLQPHGALEPYQRRRHKLRKMLVNHFAGAGVAKRADAVVFTHESEAQHAQDLVPAKAIHVVPLGAGLDRLTAEAPSFWTKDLFSRPIVTFLGRVAAKKRVDLILQAWPSVLRVEPLAKLLIVGPIDRDQEDLLYGIAASLPCESIIFTGPVYGAAKSFILLNSSAFVLPSENENFAVSVAEAFHASCPVLVSEHVALHNHVNAFKAGVVIKELTRDAVAEGILHLLSTCRRDGFAEGCRLAAREFSWESSARATLNTYKSVIANKKDS